MGIAWGNSGCLLVKGGISKLSELTIDADKNWAAMGISNLAYLAAGQTKGSVLAHDGTKIAYMAPNSIGNELTSQGPLAVPSFEPPPGP